MLKIGQFAWLNQVTTETLRHYDRLGLLKPAQIDDFTGYRYYKLEQLPRLHRILALKDLGLSLEQIGDYLDDALTVDSLNSMLALKQDELEHQIAAMSTQLAQIKTRLHQINMEGKMPDYEVVLKSVAAIHVASKREQLSSYDQSVVGPALTRMIGEVMDYIQKNSGQLDVGIVLWHDNDDPEQSKESSIDVEASVAFTGDVSGNSSVRVYDLPSCQMASTVHHGDLRGLGSAKRALFTWIEENGYQITGAIREVYLQFDANNPANHVTEIQFPVEKR